jgi:alpha-tubulin suppressor-like RCC1 family protein
LCETSGRRLIFRLEGMKRIVFLIAGIGFVAAFPNSAHSATVASGNSHTVVRTSFGEVWAWGANGNGQIGDGSTTQRSLPVHIGTYTNVSAVCAGAYHTLMLTSDGRVYGWGLNSSGQVGDGSTTQRTSPVLLSSPTNVTAIACGEYHSLALTSGGAVYAWGKNASGQVGNNSITDQTSPTQVIASGVSAIGAGASHSLAVIAADGSVKAWGLNTNGQIGDGTTTSPRKLPVAVSGLTGVAAVDGGSAFSVALLSSGALKSWGINSGGQLGDSSTTQRTSPVSVSSLSGVTAIGVGYGQTLAVKNDGTLWVWGVNASNQLGDGTTTNASTAIQSTLTSVGIVSTGYGDHSLAVTTDGAVWSWAKNGAFQVGDGTSIQRATPVSISDVNYDWRVGTPTMSPAAGNYTSNQAITVSSATSGAEIHYTTDGSDPTLSSATVSGTVTVDQNLTLKAFAWKSGKPQSNLAAAGYTLTVATPTMTPGTGTYSTAQTVTLACTTSGATIRYTTDGSTPVDTSPAYSSALAISTTTVLSARAFKTNWTTSGTGTATYTMNFGTLAAPTTSPAAGSYATSVDVTLSAAAGATIRYTTDGSTPSASSTIYAGPITLSATTTVKAKAFQTDWTASAVTTATYTIQVATPTFSPDGGTYSAGQAITIADATPGAGIHYTTNGVDPTSTDPTITSGSTVIAGNYTLKAVALKTGCTTSGVKSAAYSVTGSLGTPSVAAGYSHSLAVGADGSAWSWGSNAHGELGIGNTTQSTVPVRVSVLTGVVAVAAGRYHSLALKSDGTLWTFGDNTYGQLGLGNTNDSNRPVQVPGLTGIVAIAALLDHSLAVKNDGSVWAFGYNFYSQLGDGSTTNRLSPVQVSGLSGVIAVASGWYHSLALKGDGSVWAFGYNNYHQLGDGTTTARSTPVQVSGISSAVAVAAGSHHSLALLGDGSVKAWGNNSAGRLGDGTIVERATPVLSGLSGPSTVAGGWSHSLGVKGGFAWGWGDNTAGTIGDGTTSDRVSPALISGPDSLVRIAGGSQHSLAISSDGRVWSWGSGANGRLGDGTLDSHLSPVQIADAGMAWLVATPTFSVAGGTYTANQNVVVSTATAGATIHYTTNGAEPTESDTVVTSGGTVTISQNTTLKAKAWKTGMPASRTQAAVYVLKVAKPAFSPGGITYNTPQTVTVTDSTSGATIHWTTTGIDPTVADATVASGGTIAAGVTLTLKAVAMKTGWTDSDVMSGTYTMKVGTPSLSVAGGTYSSAQSVTVSTVTSGATLHWATDGSEPMEADPIVASGGTVVVNQSATLKVKGWKAGWTPADTTTATYTLTLGTAVAPTFDPPAGSYAMPETVSISTTTSGATVRYTLDGSDPTQFSPAYGTPLAVNANATIKARAYRQDLAASPISTAAYTITGSSVAAPQFSLKPGSYRTAVNVTVTCDTPGATIRYTTTGIDPTTSAATVASGGTLTVARGLTLKARAWSGGVASAVTRADYFVTAAVAAGKQHTLILKADGSVWASGENTYGALGDGTTTNRLSPVQVSGLGSGVVAVAAGNYHSIALKADGTVVSWGRNLNGSLGDGTTTQRNSPVTVSGLTNVVDVAAGGNVSLVLKSDGTVWGFGLNSSGQLGDGTTTTQRTTPVQAAGLTGVFAIATSGNHSLVIKGDGSVWSFGWNLYGQLGDNSGTNRSSAVAVSNLGGVSIVSAGTDFSLAVRSDGSSTGRVWAWGQDGSVGKLGDGGTAQLQRTPVGGLPGVAAVAAGDSHSLALLTDGSLQGWGAGADGRIGDGSTTDRPSPVPVTGVPALVAVAAGASHSVALAADGSVWVWGDGAFGQLGLGSTADQLVPMRIPSFAAADNAWMSEDTDGDGLTNAEEFRVGSDPFAVDTNGDGIADGAAVHTGRSATNPDMDGDGVTNTAELVLGTDPFKADTDGDGVFDGADAFALDSTRSSASGNPSDHTAPTITIVEPPNAELVP